MKRLSPNGKINVNKINAWISAPPNIPNLPRGFAIIKPTKDTTATSANSIEEN